MMTICWIINKYNRCDEMYFAGSICRAQNSDRNMIDPKTE